MDRIVASQQQLQNVIQGTVQDFVQKQERKKQQEMTYQTILPYVQGIVGGDAAQADALAKTISKNPEAGSAVFNMIQADREFKLKQMGMMAKMQEAPTLDAVGVKQLSSLFEPGGALEDIKFDKKSGKAFIRGRKGEAIPEEIRQIPGFNQYERMMKRRADVSDYAAAGISFAD